MKNVDTIYLDMDGVMCDFSGEAIRVHGRDPDEFYSLRPAPWDMEDWLGITKEEFWDLIDVEGEDFWSGLSPYLWLQDLLDIIEFHTNDTFILTSNGDFPPSLSGKQIWLNNHFGANVRKVAYTKDKWRLAKPGCVLIDDNDANCEKFVAAGGRAILFPQPWNANYKIDRPVEYVYEQLSHGDDE